MRPRSRTASHLTRRGEAWVFQIRLPRELDPRFALAPIRVTLGPMPMLRARRTAEVLAGAAQVVFKRIGSVRIVKRDRGGAGEAGADVRQTALREIEAVIPLFLGLDLLDDCPLPDELRKQVVDPVFDSLAKIGAERAAMARSDAAFMSRPEAPVLAMLRDESLARSFLGLGPIPVTPRVDDLAATLARFEQRHVEILDRLANRDARHVQADQDRKGGKKVPLFSEAADAYRDTLEAAHGPEYPELRYLDHRKAVFLALVGDKPVADYARKDLQDFANEIAWLPPNVSKSENYDVARVMEYIAANKVAQGPGLARKTILDAYLSRVKTIIREGCSTAGVPYLLSQGRIVMPRRARAPVRRVAPDIHAVAAVIERGLASGVLSDALLPPLGLIVGRRLGLLAFMRREDIVRYQGVWICCPQSHEVRNGIWSPVPVKTVESLGFFVLHDVFEQCGFIAWAKRSDGPVFPALMAAKDPADAAQKRMARLFRSTGLDPRALGTFHAYRHGKIRNDRAAKIGSHMIRAQVGHEAGSEHDRYGQDLTDGELRQIASAPLPPEIDWQGVLSRIDFDRFATRKPTGGRKPATIG